MCGEGRGTLDSMGACHEWDVTVEVSRHGKWWRWRYISWISCCLGEVSMGDDVICNKLSEQYSSESV